MSDLRYKQIGGRKRALSRYAMIRNRLNSNTKKNACYDGIELRISKEDFVEWFMKNDFEGCSVDRIDPKGHYEAGNIQLIPMKINAGKDKIKSVNGFCECFSCGLNKPMEEFVKESRRSTGYSTICLACERIRTRNKPDKRRRKI